MVTGATGFVGSAVVRCLLRRGATVRVLARRSSNPDNIEGLGAEVAYGDLLDEASLKAALQGCDMLFHVAALYGTADADSQMMYAVNVRGTKAILRAAQAAGITRIVHTSTIGTIGQPVDGSLATEETPFHQWASGSRYAKSKYLGEVVALGMARRGMPVVVVNPCAPVGARDIKPSSTGQRIVDCLKGRVPSYVVGGINFISVEDVAEGHVLAAEKGKIGQRYILGHREGNLSLAAFLALVERVSGTKRPRASGGWRFASRVSKARRADAERVKPRDLRPQALTCDPSKAIRELGLPQTPLELAFADAVGWFREHGYV
jgi:dihydroflavonol-4-reductase